MARKKTTTVSIDPSLTLVQLASKYVEHMEQEGKSAGTIFSYGMELKVAEGELGAETQIASLTAEDIARFNKCKRVTKLKSGKPKSQLSIDKTRRVLRLALAWAAQIGLIAASPIPAKNKPEKSDAPAPAKKTRKTRVVVEERTQAAPEVEARAEPVVAETAA
jgi:hypothetical protein